MINLNYENIYLNDYEFGKTQNVEIKVGRQIYYLDVDKNSNNSTISFYEKTTKNRNEQSKYSSNLHFATLKNNSILSREFFEEIEEIEKAQALYEKYGLI